MKKLYNYMNEKVNQSKSSKFDVARGLSSNEVQIVYTYNEIKIISEDVDMFAFNSTITFINKQI